MNVRKITTPAGERLVLIAEADYAKLATSLEDATDREVVDAFRRDLASGDEELIPADFVDRLLEGDSRIKVWREHRGLTAAALADAAGITQPFLSQLESGKRAGTLDTLLSIAAALGVSIQDLSAPPAHPQIRALLGERAEGLTVAELAAELRYAEGHIRASCAWLQRERIVEKDGERIRLA